MSGWSFVPHMELGQPERARHERVPWGRRCVDVLVSGRWGISVHRTGRCVDVQASGGWGISVPWAGRCVGIQSLEDEGSVCTNKVCLTSVDTLLSTSLLWPLVMRLWHQNTLLLALSSNYLSFRWIPPSDHGRMELRLVRNVTQCKVIKVPKTYEWFLWFFFCLMIQLYGSWGWTL